MLYDSICENKNIDTMDYCSNDFSSDLNFRSQANGEFINHSNSINWASL